jgi:hypothetical protein
VMVSITVGSLCQEHKFYASVRLFHMELF